MTIATYLAELERVAPPTASRASKPKRAPSGSSAPVRLSPPASPPRPRRRQCTAPSLAAAAFVAYAGQLGLRTLVTPLPLDWS